LTWKKQILPFLEADAVISQTEFADRHDYLLAMVELRGSVVIVATRFHAERAPHPEMAGIYIHAIPLVEEDQLFGCLRHMSMAGRQCLSPCIFSRTPLEMAELDRLWAEQNRGATCVHMNFPAHAGVPVPA
jgi:hypothetical protein